MGRTIDRILSEIDLLEYMQNCGYTPYKVGSCYGLKEHGSVRIYPESNTYFHPGSGDNRRLNVINFASWYHNVDNKEAIKRLAEELNGSPVYKQPRRPPKPISEIEKKAFILPEKSNMQYKRLFAYLCTKRGIDRDVVTAMIHRKMLYQDEKGNATFVGFKDEKEVFCFQRGTGDMPYKHIVAGSDFTTAWHVDNGADKIFVSEAVIDSMSIMTMLKIHNLNPSEYNYLATGGPSMKAVVNHVNNSNIKSVYLSYDSDDAGRKYVSKAKEELCKAGYKGTIIDKPPKTKDFNEDLQLLKKNKAVAKENTQSQPKQQTQKNNNYVMERNL